MVSANGVDDTLVRAVLKMDRRAARQLAVVDSKKQQAIGLLTMSDVVRAHARAAVAAGDGVQDVSPPFSEESGLAQ